MTWSDVFVATFAALATVGVIALKTWGVAYNQGWRTGLTDRDKMYDQVYGPGWKTKIIEHDLGVRSAEAPSPDSR